MRLYELNDFFDNWVLPNAATRAADFNEYKHKESTKWKSRADRMGFRWPIFDQQADYDAAIQSSPVVSLNDGLDFQVNNRSHSSSLDQLKRLVSSYAMPRDVDRIVAGFKSNAAMPLPVILKGKNGMWIMSGNTRLDTAGILGIPKKAIIVDVSQ